jgi:predicted O-methyltransferase YrrM
MSTLWLADRFNSVISVESNRDWYKRISSKLIDRTNVKYLYRESSCYTDIPALSQIDLVVIDGDRRADCIDWAMARLKPGAWLYLDNSDADKDHVPGQPNRTFLARHKLLQLASEGRLSLETFRGFPPACLVASEGILARVSA